MRTAAAQLVLSEVRTFGVERPATDRRGLWVLGQAGGGDACGGGVKADDERRGRRSTTPDAGRQTAEANTMPTCPGMSDT